MSQRTVRAAWMLVTWFGRRFERWAPGTMDDVATGVGGALAIGIVGATWGFP